MSGKGTTIDHFFFFTKSWISFVFSQYFSMLSKEKESQGRPFCFLQLPDRRLEPGGGCPRQQTAEHRAKNLKLWQGMFRLHIKENLSMARAVKHWNRLARALMESPFLGLCMWHLRKWFRGGLGSAKVGWWLDLRNSEVFSNLIASVILRLGQR